MKKYNVKFSLDGTVVARNADIVPDADELGKYIETMLAPTDNMKADITVSYLEATEVADDVCEGCMYLLSSDTDEPCASCENNYTSKWEPLKGEDE